ncbi:MAG: tellurite resistance TerB family protein [Desulfobulbaceae bacterium]|nr:tellurite resistance TerB family protein [Desulfobulbaceae bacterium]
MNVEKLLGKMIQGLNDDSHMGYKKKYDHKKKYKKKHKSKDLMSQLAGNVLSGKGLMTAIGLGVGAYTIMKDKTGGTNQQQTQIPPQQNYQAPPASPPPPPSSMPPVSAPPATPSVTSPQNISPQQTNNHRVNPPHPSNDENLAINCIQVMIAAAHADGQLDSTEEAAIIERFREAGLNKEEKKYILHELHNPKTIPELTTGMNDPKINQTIYSLAVSTIIIDTETERQWLNQLAEALSISKDMQQFLEE